MNEMVIRGVRPGMKDISLTFIILEVARPTKTKEGREVRTVKVSDKSGSINLSLWDELGKLVQSGDIIRLTKGYAQIFKNCLTLYLSKGSEFTKTGEFCQVFNEMPFLSEPNSEIVTAALQGAPPAPPGSHGGGNGGGSNKPPMFRGGGGMANNGNSLPGAQPPGLPPPMGGGSRFPTNGEQRAQPPIGHNVPPPGMPPAHSGNKWPVHNAARPVPLKDKVR